MNGLGKRKETSKSKKKKTEGKSPEKSGEKKEGVLITEVNPKKKAIQEDPELKKKEAREARAKEVADAYNKYVELFNAFVKDYGYYVDYRKSAGDEMLRVFNTFFNWPL